MTMRHDLYQRGQNGNCIPGDAITHAAYGPIPSATEFQNQNYGFEVPIAIEGWQFSITFGRWSALVTFENGWRGFTFPRG